MNGERLTVAVALVISASCGSDLPELGEELFQELSLIAMTAARSPRGEATCHGAVLEEPPDSALILGTNLCLSCASVGPLLRRRAREGRRDVIVVASIDAEPICRFLTAEKVRIPVFAVSGPEFGQAAWLPQILVTDLEHGDWRTIAVLESDVGNPLNP